MLCVQQDRSGDRELAYHYISKRIVNVTHDWNLASILHTIGLSQCGAAAVRSRIRRCSSTEG